MTRAEPRRNRGCSYDFYHLGHILHPDPLLSKGTQFDPPEGFGDSREKPKAALSEMDTQAITSPSDSQYPPLSSQGKLSTETVSQSIKR